MQVDQLLEEAIEKLNQCGFNDKAEWIIKRKLLLKSPETRIQALKELQPIWTGMGSFHDLPWPRELENWSWEFVEKIYCAIKDELNQTST
jgi:hypothetical protein